MSISRLPTSLDAARGDVRAAIGAAAQRTGVDFSYLMAQAKSESGLDPSAKSSSSSATGLYQFLDQSWLAIVKRHGEEHGFGWASDAISARPGGGYTVAPAARQAVMALREQAGPASLMAASYASDNAQSLGRTLGRETNATDLYFAHFLGLAGARRFLQAADAAPDSTAAALFPREAQANRSIFYDKAGGARSLGQVYALMGRKLAANGADTDMAVAGGAGGAADMAIAGALVAEPPSTGTQGMRLPMDTSVADAAAPDADVATTLASLERDRMDVLRPTPAQARLAYLMLSMPLA